MKEHEMNTTATPAKPATPAKKPSRASRSAAQNKPAAATKPAAKPAAAKPASAKPAPAKDRPAGSVKDLDRADKQALAAHVVTAAAAVMDADWAKLDGIRHLDKAAAGQQISNWLAYLPGEAWDARLPVPTVGSRAAK